MTLIPEVLVMPLLAAAAASVACGTVGSITLVRRSTYVAGAVSHSVLAGLGIAQYLSVVQGMTWFSPTAGALLTAIAAALFVSRMQTGKTGVNDAALSAVWVVGMAVGMAFLNATPGYQGDLMNYLFGSILLVSSADILTMAALDAVIITAAVLCWRGIMSVCFNSELALARGVRARFFETVIALVTALAVVLLVRIVGIVLVIALLTLPAMAARQFVRRMVPLQILSSVFAFISIVAGLAVSWHADCQPSPPIVFSAGVLAVLPWGVSRLHLRFMRKRAAR